MRFRALLKPVLAAILLTTTLFVAAVPSNAQSPGGITAPGGSGGSGGAARGEAAAQRLVAEEKNQYRGGVGSFKDVEDNMKNLFEKLLSTAGEEMHKHYSPHLRDISDQINRSTHAVVRGLAGTTYSTYYCFGACPGCVWIDDHYTNSCCNGGTTTYLALQQDTNFKTCCVREGEENLSEEEIACRHPQGDGWAGLFEYYFPTTAIGWENDRTTTMIVEKEKVDACIEESDALMEGQDAIDWVTDAIVRNAEATGGSADRNEVQQNVQSVIKEVRPQDKNLRFSDSLQGEGLTMRVNFATMNDAERRALARHFCMHEDQFMKLMDPEEDPFQLSPGAGGGPSGGGGGSGANPGGISLSGLGNASGMLQNIPVFSNYCPSGVKLMTKAENSINLNNIDGTDTDLAKGFINGFRNPSLGPLGPLYCQAMHAQDNSYFTEEQRQMIQQLVGATSLNEQAVGYTCRNNGQAWVGLSPVTLFRTAQVERRAPEHALAFAIAGGLVDRQDRKSYYKRFEPMPYSQRAGIFTGKAFRGGFANELGMTCESIRGENYQGQDKPDQWYISNKTHKFKQENIQDFNKYYSEWTTDGNTPSRGLDGNSQNYAAMSRIFATCPKNYRLWRGDHSSDVQGPCGQEKLW